MELPAEDTCDDARTDSPRAAHHHFPDEANPAYQRYSSLTGKPPRSGIPRQATARPPAVALSSASLSASTATSSPSWPKANSSRSTGRYRHRRRSLWQLRRLHRRRCVCLNTRQPFIGGGCGRSRRSSSSRSRSLRSTTSLFSSTAVVLDEASSVQSSSVTSWTLDCPNAV